MDDATQSLVSETLERHGFSRWGITMVERPHSFEHYRRWIGDGFHGEMGYLEDHLPQKENPDLLLPNVKSAIVVAIDYFPSHPEPPANDPVQRLPVAAYAKGQDYHFWLRAKLDSVIRELKTHLPDQSFLAMTDSHPVMERDLARRAGLGWFGKNTCLIDAKAGSFFLIGEIFSSLEIAAAVLPSPDQCGTCSRCIDACPTQALSEDLGLDARKCISYWTIEARGVPPQELRHQVGSWFFGCDICQRVCPWNEKAFGRAALRAPEHPASHRSDLVAELRWVLTTSNNSLQKSFAGTPLTRPGGRGLKRNAILMAVHHGLTELKGEIANAGETLPELKELSLWATNSL